MEKVKIILPIHSALAPHVSASGAMSAPDSAVDRDIEYYIMRFIFGTLHNVNIIGSMKMK
jgi:hypothetical protein